MTTTGTLQTVTITLGPDADTQGRIRILVTSAEGVVYSRSTKYDAGIISRTERYLTEAGIYRQTAYTNDGDNMVATGMRTA